MGTLLKNIIAYISRFIMLQLFISCISLPLLSYWGLPQPILSPLGNIIFAPFLTFFLLFSTFTFFAYILALPTMPFIWVLEKITVLWTYVLSLNIPTPFVSCVQPPLYLCLALPCAALFVITRKKCKEPVVAITSFLFLLFIAHAVLYCLHTPRTFIYPLECNGAAVTIIKNKNAITVIDPGVIGKRLSAVSWCEHTLASEIMKKTGSHVIDHFVCLRPGKNLFDALTQLTAKVVIRHLYIPWWTNNVPSSCWRSYVILKKKVLHTGGTIHTVSGSTKIVGQTGLSIHATQKIRAYHEAQFPQFYIEGIIDNNCVSIYAP